MKRKHECFTYNYGWRTAPEQWSFYLNQKRINLNPEIRNTLACLCLSGKIKEAEDELKRLLRKEEKEMECKYITFAFFEKDSKNFFYTQDLKAKPNDIMDRLRIYKTWKEYIFKENKGYLQPFTVKTGYFSPYGNEDVKTEGIGVEIDKNKCITIKIVKNKDNAMFTF